MCGLKVGKFKAFLFFENMTRGDLGYIHLPLKQWSKALPMTDVLLPKPLEIKESHPLPQNACPSGVHP